MYIKPVSALLTSLLLVGCGDKNKNTEPSGNQAPVSSFVQPESGDKLYANSTDNSGTDDLTYEWLVNGVLTGVGSTFNTSSLTGDVEITLITTDEDGLTNEVVKDFSFNTTNPTNPTNPTNLTHGPKHAPAASLSGLAKILYL